MPDPNLDFGLDYTGGITKPTGDQAGYYARVDSLGLNLEYVPLVFVPTTAKWVDITATPGGDGSANFPFQTITQALAVSLDNGLIYLAAGIYTESFTIAHNGVTIAAQPGTDRSSVPTQLTGNILLSGPSPGNGAWRFENIVFNGTCAVTTDRIGYPIFKDCVWGVTTTFTGFSVCNFIAYSSAFAKNNFYGATNIVGKITTGGVAYLDGAYVQNDFKCGILSARNSQFGDGVTAHTLTLTTNLGINDAITLYDRCLGFHLWTVTCTGTGSALRAEDSASRLAIAKAGIIFTHPMVVYAGDQSNERAGNSAFQTTNAPATLTIDFNNSGDATDITSARSRAITLVTGASPCVLTLTAPIFDTELTLYVFTGAGGSTITWPSNVHWAGGSAPTLTATAAKLDIFKFRSRNGILYGSVAGQNYTP